MTEETVYEEEKNNEQIPICQKCFKNIAGTVCGECGCPLCIKCIKRHVCNLDDGKNGEENKKPLN